MIKQFVRFAIVATLWKRYKNGILSVLALLLFWFLLGFFHGEYVSYAEATDSKQHLALSFFIKWALGIAALTAFVMYHLPVFGFENKTAEPELPPQDKKQANSVEPSDNKEPKPPKPGDADYRANEDPFAELRDKDKLRSRGDIELSKQRHS